MGWDTARGQQVEEVCGGRKVIPTRRDNSLEETRASRSGEHSCGMLQPFEAAIEDNSLPRAPSSEDARLHVHWQWTGSDQA